MARRRHTRTDPICDDFAGVGTVHWVLGVQVLSWRRILYRRGMGRTCPVCRAARLEHRRATTPAGPFT